VFTSDKLDSLTRSSDIGIISSLTSKKQSNVKLALNYWSPKNKYHYIALINYKNFPFSFYGIGDETLAANKSLLSQKLLRLNCQGERHIYKNYYGGLNAQLEGYVYKSTSDNKGLHLGDFYGGKGGKYIPLGVSQVYDARNSNTYTSKGLYGRIK